MNFDKPKITKNLIFVILTVMLCCCKNDNIDLIPYVPVQQTVNSGEIATFGINTAIKKPGGNKGLIIYRKSSDEFVVFDRICTYFPNDTSAVVLEESQQIAICPKCESRFILIDDGSKTNDGPAQLPLRKYRCFYENGRLTIVN